MFERLSRLNSRRMSEEEIFSIAARLLKEMRDISNRFSLLVERYETVTFYADPNANDGHLAVHITRYEFVYCLLIDLTAQGSFTGIWELAGNTTPHTKGHFRNNLQVSEPGRSGPQVDRQIDKNSYTTPTSWFVLHETSLKRLAYR